MSLQYFLSTHDTGVSGTILGLALVKSTWVFTEILNILE